MRLAQAAAAVRGALRGADAVFTGVAIDSRAAQPGDLFVAIDASGARDGHDFIEAAADKGAAGALVARAGGAGDIPRIEVADTTAALGALGANWRRRFELPVVAVTGSNGKTTVTALIASIFNAGGCCLAPRASFNNQWGVPLTLLRLRDTHTHAVVEMGMNHAGEIARLTELARPTVALITNAAPAHLAGLKDLQGVAAAKAEIFRGLGGDGVAVVNADDQFHAFWRAELGRLGVARIVRFSVADATVTDAGERIDIRAAKLPDGRIEIEIDGQTVVAGWHLPGAHNLANAAAAAAAAHAAGATAAQIVAGLGAFPGALPGRLHTFTGARGATVIDDSYNANPASMRAALDYLARAGGTRIAVLGAMAELGDASAQLHAEVGAHGRGRVDHLLGLAESDSAAADIDALLTGFGGGEKFATLDELLGRLRPLVDERVTVLIKGSRSTDMGRVVDRLKPAPASATVTGTSAGTSADTGAAPAQQNAGVAGRDASAGVAGRNATAGVAGFDATGANTVTKSPPESSPC